MASPFDQLSPDDRAYALRVLSMPENKGRSADEIVAAIREQQAVDAAPAPEQPGLVQRGLQGVTSGLQAVRDATNPLLAMGGQYSPIDALQAVASRLTGGRIPAPQPAVPDDVALRAADRVNPVPSSATEAAAMGPLLLIPGGGLVRTLGKAALATASGAATGAAENGVSGAERGAATGAIAGAAPLLGKLVHYGRVKLGMIEGPGAARAASEAASPEIAQAIGEDVPVLGKVTGNSAEGLLNLRDPAVGLKALRDQFAKSDRAIVSHFGDQPVNLPSLSPVSPEAQQIAARLGVDPSHPVVQQALKKLGLPPTSSGIPVQQALDSLKQLKEVARFAPDGATGFAARQQARQVESELMAALPADLRTGYQAAVGDYDKGLDTLAVLRRSGAFTGDTKGPTLDVDRMRDFLVQNMEEFPPSRLPKLWHSVFGDVPGARDVLSKLYGPRVYLGPVGVGTPPVPFRQRVGAPEIPPSRGRLWSLGGAAALRSFKPEDAQ